MEEGKRVGCSVCLSHEDCRVSAMSDTMFACFMAGKALVWFLRTWALLHGIGVWSPWQMLWSICHLLLGSVILVVRVGCTSLMALLHVILTCANNTPKCREL